MRRRFQKANRNQILLLPPSIDDWVAEEHLARFIWDCVASFDLKPVSPNDAVKHDRKANATEPESRIMKDKNGIEQTPKALAADAGYWHDGLNVQGIENEGTELFIATARHKERESAEQEPAPRGRIPKDASKRERMTGKLRTERGKAVYRQRCQTVGPIFGQIKSAMGFDRFLRRGPKAVQSEWLLICACCNLLKLHRFAFS